MMSGTLISIKDKVLSGDKISYDEALELTFDKTDVFDLFVCANEIREHFMSNSVVLCSIVNAKSGICSEDCSFCSQSSKYKTDNKPYSIMDLEELKQNVDSASKRGATEFSFVTSGRKLGSNKGNGDELKLIAEAIKYTKDNTSMEACSSLGLMSKEELSYLKSFGMDHYHHNLETSRSNFSNIVSSHSYDDELLSVRNAKKAGLKTCCGGIFGMGESWEQRLELAFDLKELDVDSIPINFLVPIPKTPLEHQEMLNPYEALRIVSIFRFIFPDKNIMVMGGREKVLGDMQSWIFFAGANGLLVGNYLTTKGRSYKDDIKMIKDLGFEVNPVCNVKTS